VNQVHIGRLQTGPVVLFIVKHFGFLNNSNTINSNNNITYVALICMSCNTCVPESAEKLSSIIICTRKLHSEGTVLLKAKVDYRTGITIKSLSPYIELKYINIWMKKNMYARLYRIKVVQGASNRGNFSLLGSAHFISFAVKLL